MIGQMQLGLAILGVLGIMFLVKYLIVEFIENSINQKKENLKLKEKIKELNHKCLVLFLENKTKDLHIKLMKNISEEYNELTNQLIQKQFSKIKHKFLNGGTDSALHYMNCEMPSELYAEIRNLFPNHKNNVYVLFDCIENIDFDIKKIKK